MRIVLLSLALLAQAATGQYTCKKIVPPVVLAKPSATASYVAKPNDPPNAACQTSKGVCAADKVILCHMEGTFPLTLCLPEVSVPKHLKEHKDDFCGCCGPTEKTIPAYCGGKKKGAF